MTEIGMAPWNPDDRARHRGAVGQAHPGVQIYFQDGDGQMITDEEPEDASGGGGAIGYPGTRRRGIGVW
jgi:hypothetical protein